MGGGDPCFSTPNGFFPSKGCYLRLVHLCTYGCFSVEEGTFRAETRTHWTVSSLSFLFPTLWFETVCFAIVIEGVDWTFTSWERRLYRTLKRILTPVRGALCGVSNAHVPGMLRTYAARTFHRHTPSPLSHRIFFCDCANGIPTLRYLVWVRLRISFPVTCQNLETPWVLEVGGVERGVGVPRLK